jgi:hypothetical protein
VCEECVVVPPYLASLLVVPSLYEYQTDITDALASHFAHICVGQNSVVGIATRYELDGPGTNPSGGEIFSTSPD